VVLQMVPVLSHMTSPMNHLLIALQMCRPTIFTQLLKSQGLLVAPGLSLQTFLPLISSSLAVAEEEPVMQALVAMVDMRSPEQQSR
jgi:hypothetical protein